MEGVEWMTKARRRDKLVLRGGTKLARPGEQAGSYDLCPKGEQ